MVSVLLFGFVVGLWHALDCDHIAAMITFAASREATPKKAFIYGLMWASGHAAMLFLMTVLMMIFHVEVSNTVASFMEFAVGAMLVVLAADMFRRVADIRIHSHDHVHDGSSAHDHVHVHRHSEVHEHGAHLHAHKLRENHYSRAVVVGLMHGLAGSAALVILVMRSVVSFSSGMAYVLVFSAGATAGMAALSTCVALSVRRSTFYSPAIAATIRRCGAAFVLSMGLLLMSTVVTEFGPWQDWARELFIWR